MTDTLAIPATPRPLSIAARRRSWAEMPVRIWVILALALAAVIVYFTVSRVAEGASERDLIRHGTLINATVTRIDGFNKSDYRFPRNQSHTVTVRFVPPGETRPRDDFGTLSIIEHGADDIHPGDVIPIRIDPTDLERWTDRSEPRSWLIELLVAMVLLPFLAILLFMAVLKRAQMLRIWQHGDAAEAIVADAKQTAVAPFSRLVRMTLATGNDRRVFGILIPAAAGIPQRGETVQVVLPRGNPKLAVLAKLYM